MKKLAAWRSIPLFAGGILLLLIFNNCGGKLETVQTEQSSTAQETSNCVLADLSLRQPKTIDETTNLINALPKPLTLPCFLENLQRPLQVSAVDSTFSAQPSAGANNPRVFIIIGEFILSVAPTGLGKNLLEMSEYTPRRDSVKAELEFPIRENIPLSKPYDHVRFDFGTSCRFCHTGERPVTGYSGVAFASTVMKPDPFKKVLSTSLREISLNCDSAADAYRCQILRAVFVTGQAKDSQFPP